MCLNVTEPDRPEITILSMRFACLIPKAIDTHLVCVILIAFPLQQWLHERTSILRYTCTVCLVYNRDGECLTTTQVLLNTVYFICGL